jgi:large conductance mechanosensitive channel
VPEERFGASCWGSSSLAFSRSDKQVTSRRRLFMITELRDFLFRGNIVELAVAFVIGAAFAAITVSLVEDILTPLLGLLGIPDFSTWTIAVGDAEMRIGNFLNTLISFVLIGVSIFFLVV